MELNVQLPQNGHFFTLNIELNFIKNIFRVDIFVLDLASASVFGQRLNIFKYSAVGFGQM